MPSLVIRPKSGLFPDEAADHETPENPLDSDEAQQELSRLLGWFYMERDKQSANRMEMAIDHDFYDNDQWNAEDAAILKDRGQMPLVYNEVAPMVDWLIGTERRTRVDWSILPRAEDDVQLADIKEKVLKYVSDVNRVPFARSRAFADAIKGGVGWLDDGARDDPTQDVLYSKYEDWRSVLWDSESYELDLSDARYVFRWRWVDEDIALSMFPERAEAILAAALDSANGGNGGNGATADEDWFLGERLAREGSGVAGVSGVASAHRSQFGDETRRRVRLIECQYRKPVKQKIVADGALRGAFLHEDDAAMMQSVANEGSLIDERVVMRVHFAVFTETHLLSMGVSPYRHNRFTLTPIWCYRRGRDRLPYGVIRRVRDIQQDMNKRASKALFLLNTNQVIANEGAVDDWNKAMDEVSRPDGLIVTKQGKEFSIRRDSEAANGQLQMMTMAAQSIQKTAGINNENLGRATNAVSGAAITARQQQGAVGTTEPFDNLRFAVQIQGEKQLSLTEQFYTEQKVIRLTGEKNRIEWVRINQPEPQADGSVRWLNDISSSMADFVVSEQDYAGTLRQVMFDSLNQLATRLPPEISMKLLPIAFEFSDMPNKDELVKAIREAIGQADPNAQLTPEEQQAQQQAIAAQQQAQAEAIEAQRQATMLSLQEQQAKVRELNAQAAKLEAEAMSKGGHEDVRRIQAEAADRIDALSNELRKVQFESEQQIMAIKRDADQALEIARIEAETKIRVAEIGAANKLHLTKLSQSLSEIEKSQNERNSNG